MDYILDTEDEYLTVKDLMVLLKISKNLAYRLVALPGFPAMKFGYKTVRMKKSEVQAWLDANTGTGKSINF